MRALAFLFGLPYVVGSGLAVFVALVAYLGPDENPTPENTTEYDAALLPAVLAFLLALVVVGAVGAARRRLALGSYAAQAAAAGVLVALALRMSAHSDGKIVAFALPVELCDLAVALSART